MFLQQRSHENRKQDSGSVPGIILGVDEITLSYPVRILVAESIKRGMSPVARGLHFYRTHLAPSMSRAVRPEDSDFHVFILP